MQRTVTQLQFAQQFPGLVGVNVMASDFPMEPFLVFTEFHMDRPVFGPHPHAGISVMTYILPDSAGSFYNRDSQGDFSRIEPGGLHITQAGRGVHHDEFPVVSGTDVHGFQIWINHREGDRLVEPRAMHATASEIPEWRDGQVTVRVVQGSYRGVVAAHRLVTEVTLLHVRAAGPARIELPVAPMSFVYGLGGKALLDGERVGPQRLLTLADAPSLTIEVGAEGAEFMFAAGTPLNEPIVYGGPFVMTTPAQMRETERRYARGEMGMLQAH